METRISKWLRSFVLLMAILMLTGCAGNGVTSENSTPAPSATSTTAVSATPTASWTPRVFTFPLPSNTLEPTPSRHPEDPIEKYPVPLTGHTRPLTVEEAGLLFGISGVSDLRGPSVNTPILYVSSKYDQRAFTPDCLTERFEPEKLYRPKEVFDYLSSIKWLWNEASMLEYEGKRIFFQFWEREIPLKEPLVLFAAGFYMIDPNEYDQDLTRGSLYEDDGVIYLFTRDTEGTWRLLHRVEDIYRHKPMGLALAINESNTAAWIVETMAPGTGTGHESSDIVWRNLTDGGIDLQYRRYLMSMGRWRVNSVEPDDGLRLYEYEEIATVLYGLRYDWLADGTRFIRAPDRLTVQIEHYFTTHIEDVYDHSIPDSDEKEARGLVTMEFLCDGGRYQLISLISEAVDSLELVRKYTDIGGPMYSSGMPSFGYKVGMDWWRNTEPKKELFD